MIPIDNILYLLLLLATLVASALGVVIVFQAYRGYRRNDSRPMLYVAIGFALLTLAPFTLSLVFTVVARTVDVGPLALTYVLPLLSRSLEIVGLGVILYSLLERAS